MWLWAIRAEEPPVAEPRSAERTGFGEQMRDGGCASGLWLFFSPLRRMRDIPATPLTSH